MSATIADSARPTSPRGDADRLRGVLAAALTPVDADLAPDFDRATQHCRWLLAQGCDGLAVLGTTGEANSFSVAERSALLDHLVGNGVPAAALLPGTGCAALSDSVALTRHAVRHGVGGCLMLPPFYYKSVADDGLFAAYAEVIERVGDPGLRIYLYHFPQMSGVPLSLRLIERLVTRYPATVVGMKDSSGDLANMLAVVGAVPGFTVLSGSDELLLPLLEGGGAGCITACANVAAPLAASVLALWRQGNPGAGRAQERLSQVRRVIQRYPLAPALKSLIAAAAGEPGWRRLRPPLVPLGDDAAAALARDLAEIDFAPPAWP
jgi:4-hydroxy-tetrahydrodipicolinate synthase